MKNNNSDVYTAALAVILGAWTGFANPVLHFPILSLLLPAGLAWMARYAPSSKAAFSRTFWSATLGYAGSLYWLVIPVHYYGGFNWFLAIPCPILVAMLLALYAGLFGLVLHWGRALSPLLFGILAGTAWASIEALREVLFTGFPWLTLASAFGPWPIFLQSASYIGGVGLGGVLAASSAWFCSSGIRTGHEKIAALLTLGLLLGYGYMAKTEPLPTGEHVTACVAQGNIDQSLKWDPKFQQETVNRYLTLSQGVIADEHPDFIVWPETALPFYLQDLTELGTSVRRFVHRNKVPLLTGSPAYTYNPQSKDFTLFNRAYLISPGQAQMMPYDKVHLLPFGEYMPFAEYIPFKKIVETAGDFAPGRNHEPLRVGKVAMGMLICYEAIFSELAQLRVAKGANVLVNISNDAWFGRSSAALQHLYLSSLRAVEQRRWMVRSTNTGISAFISPAGHILDATKLYVATTTTRQIALLNTTTFFHRNFHTVHWIIYSLAAVLLAWSIATGRRKTLR